MPKSGIAKKKGSSKSTRAGLQFPVGRVRRLARERTNNMRMGDNAVVYATAVLEYLSAEVLETAGNVAKDHKQKRITPRYIATAIRNDAELAHLNKSSVFASDGVEPNIHHSLLQGKAAKEAKKMMAK